MSSRKKGCDLDFFRVTRKTAKGGGIEISPEFRGHRSKDLMVRGGKFYAVWNEATGCWSVDEYDVYHIVDKALWEKAEALKEDGYEVVVKTMESFSSGMLSAWNRYISAIGDNYHPLDRDILFANDEVRKTSYATKRLPYSLEPGDYSAWDELVGLLYSPEERRKIEWAIGSIVAGDSKDIQKFLVFYGETGTGKSTILNIVEKLFYGYTAVFDAKALGSSSGTFSTEAFKTNPRVAIQHDGDLSRIEDNTKLNSIVSHEIITINEKYKTPWELRVESFLFMGTNSPVKISDSRSGIIRRLIDVHPTGNLFPPDYYQVLMARVEFELGAIAWHCMEVYKKLGPNYYNGYRPIQMMYSTNVFFNFVESYFVELQSEEGITLKRAWSLYKEFCEESNNKPMQMQMFRTEMMAYFKELNPRTRVNGQVVTNLFTGFKHDKLTRSDIFEESSSDWLVLDKVDSLLDDILADAPAQYANSSGNPSRKWVDVTTSLADLDTTRLHFVKVPEHHIVIDFDLANEDGEKSLAENLRAVEGWVPTYTELSKSGNGLHLHYIYQGDVEELSNEYSKGIEIKTLRGDASLRRKLTRCNDLPIAVLTSGLPTKEKRKMLDTKVIKSERGLRELINRNLRKEIHPGTKPSIDFIKTILDEVHEEGLVYDVTDLRSRIIAFANNSTNRPIECLKIVQQMKFKSEDDKPSQEPAPADDRIIFFDVEVYPNLFVVCWKYEGEGASVVRLVNPTPSQVEELFAFKLVGFNNRRYDNHILYARYLGYDNQTLYELSQKIINPQDKSRRSFFGEAYNLSYADIFDFSSKKQGLKKFQIELGLPHQELDHPWDQPVPESMWDKVVDYCANDVRTTEQVFRARAQDFAARKILADISGLEVNDTTQRHTAKIIFGDNRSPQREFVYTDLSKDFPGYSFDHGKSTYRGEDPSEGGYVYAEPGMHTNVAVLDVASMHPTSIIVMNMFGPYTKNFKELVEARLAIKHGKLDKAKKMLGGRLAPYLDDLESLGDLSYALKIVINIVYGLTSAKFDNPFNDPRNKDNIVAKRGALFMIDLKNAVQERGFTVAHIKTDSIKIPNATPEIIAFVQEFGNQYGYSFEHEKTYDQFCLVNDAVYIAREGDHWDAVGAQFQHPVVFKTLFSFEPIEFRDMAETKSVSKGAIYIDFNGEKDEDDPAAGMHFIGRTGSFVPVTSGGGKLYRIFEGKHYALAGTKGYQWMETEMASQMIGGFDKKPGIEIDQSYYDRLVEQALYSLKKYGSYRTLVLEGREEEDVEIPLHILELDERLSALDQGLNYETEIANG
jgi:hypothetical protein